MHGHRNNHDVHFLFLFKPQDFVGEFSHAEGVISNEHNGILIGLFQTGILQGKQGGFGCGICTGGTSCFDLRQLFPEQIIL